MAELLVPGPSGAVSAIEYAPPNSQRRHAFVLLLPGTSIRPGPGADAAAKYCFEAKVQGIYKTVAERLAKQHDLPVLQLCWRCFPSDGGTTHDAVHDILACVRFMRSRYGQHCGTLMVGYSFGGAAIWALLAHMAEKPEKVEAALGEAQEPCGRPPWLYGLVALSGSLKGSGDDNVSLFSALKCLDKIRTPLLIVHGSDDDNVTVSAAYKLFRKVQSMKALCLLDGADHNLREPAWRRIIPDVLTSWLAQVAVPRGLSTACRGRAVLQALHAASAELCSISMTEPSVTLALDPVPQHPSGGIAPSYHAFEVPTTEDAFVAPQLPGGLKCLLPMKRREEIAAKTNAAKEHLSQIVSIHADRQRRAREQAEAVRKGSVGASYAKRQLERRRSQLEDKACLRPLALEGSHIINSSGGSNSVSGASSPAG